MNHALYLSGIPREESWEQLGLVNEEARAHDWNEMLPAADTSCEAQPCSVSWHVGCSTIKLEPYTFMPWDILHTQN
jgi:hypothetical protein